MRFAGKRNDVNSLMVAPSLRQASLFIASHNEVPQLGLGIQQQFHNAAALWAISRSRQGNEQARPFGRQRLSAAHQQSPPADRLRTNAKLVLQRQPYAFGRILGTARARQREMPNP